MTKEERYDIFEKYLRGTLNGLEQKEFESNLASSPELQKELELHKGLHQAIGDKKLQYFAELVQESESNYIGKKSKNNISFLKKYSRRIAAGAAVLFLAVMSYLFLFPKPTAEKLFAEYFEPYNAPGTFRSEDLATLDNDFILALARYDEGQYAEAANYFSKTLEKSPDKDIAIFLRGVSYLAVDSLVLAEDDLKAVVEDEESLFQDQGRWYLGMVYLKQGKKEKAQTILTSIKANSNKKTLLEKLE